MYMDFVQERVRSRTIYEYREAAQACMDLERYSRMASSLLRAKVGLITFLDESSQFAMAESNKYEDKIVSSIIPRADTVCQHTVQQDEQAFVVKDLTKDHRFSHFDIVANGPRIKTYAGFPIKTQEGHNIGAVCALDDSVREWTPDELQILRDLGRMIANDLNLYFTSKDVLVQQRMQSSIVAFIRSNLQAYNKSQEDLLPNEICIAENTVFRNAVRLLRTTLDVEGVLIIGITDLLKSRGRRTPLAPHQGTQAHLLACCHTLSSPEIELEALTEALCLHLVAEGSQIYQNGLPKDVQAVVGSSVESAVAVPLFDTENKPYGLVIALSTSKSSGFTSTVVEYVEAFGSTLMLELQRAKLRDADEVKAQFISSLSHELRTPLHGLMHNLDALTETNLNQEQKDLIREIAACSNLQLTLVESVLELSQTRKEGPVSGPQSRADEDFEVIDVVAVVEEAVNSAVQRYQRTTHDIHKSRQVEIIVDYPRGVHDARFRYTNRRRLKTVVQQLVSNSLKWTTSGFIRIAIDVSRTTDDDDEVYISISDTGSGISADFMDNKLYKNFTQEDTFSVGLGLGLSLVHESIEALGGTIDIDSLQNAYTSVHLSIPMRIVTHQVPPGRLRLRSTNTNIGVYRPASATQGEQLLLTILERDLQAACAGTITITDQAAKCGDFDILFICRSSLVDIQQSAKDSTLIIMTGYTEEVAIPDSTSLNSPYVLSKSSYGPCLLDKLLRDAIESAKTTHQQEQQKNGSGLKRRLSSESDNSGSSPRKSRTNGQGIGTPMGAPRLTKEDLDPAPEYQILDPANNNSISSKHPLLRKEGSGEQNKNPGDADSTVRTPKVLIVEDNPTNSRLLTRFMEKKGFVFEAVGNGLEAVRAVEATKDSGSKGFDVILMDIQMPIMDGLQATERIREVEEGGVPSDRAHIVACTGLSAQSDKQKAVQVGCDNFLTKPITLSTLRTLFDDWSKKLCV